MGALIMASPEFILYGYTHHKAKKVVEYGIALAETAGGFKPEVIAEIEERMKYYRLDDSNVWKLKYSLGEVQYDQPLALELSGQHKFYFINLFATGKGVITVPINTYKSGTSHVYYR